MEIQQNQRRYVSAVELSSMIGLSEDAIWRLARLGKIPSVRIGRRVMFKPDEVFKMIEEK